MKKSLFKILSLLFLTLFLLLPMANSEDMAAEEMLYSKRRIPIYSKADKASTMLSYIEPYKPFLFTVEGDFAFSEKLGGYIEYSRLSKLKVKPLAEKSVFFENIRKLYSFPMESAEVIRELDLEEELTLLGTSYGFVKVEDSHGNIGFVPSKNMKEVGKQRRIKSPSNVFARFPATVLEKPILGAKVQGYLVPYSVYTVTEHSRGFVKIEDGDLLGYAELDSLQQMRTTAKWLLVAYSSNPFTLKDENGVENEGSYTYLIERRHGVVKEKESKAVLSSENMQIMQIQESRSSMVVANKELSLYKDVNCTLENGENIAKDRLVYVFGQTPSSYLIRHDGMYSFVKKSDVNEVERSAINRSLLRFLEEVAIPLPSGEMCIYEKNAFAFANAIYGENYLLEGEELHFVSTHKVAFLGQDVPLDEKLTTLQQDTMFYPEPHPDSVGIPLEKGKIVKILAFHGKMAKLELDGQAGYVPLEAVDHYEFDAIPSEAKKYEIHINKSKATLSVYEVLADGSLSKQPAVESMVAIGRNTSPTPSGTFPLGYKERWHKWSASYSPYAMEFTPARYIHGLLYERPKPESLMYYSETYFGQKATGGCLRSPDEVAKWIYYNCPSIETRIVITED